MNSNRKERVVVYIDGNNFYKYLRDRQYSFPKGVKFNFEKFINMLINGRELVSKRYYIGIAKNFDNSEKSKEIVRGQQKFLNELQREGFVIKRGKVIYDSGKIREKGVDVKISVDLVIGAVDNIFDTAILVSSDTDLIPAIKYVRFKGKSVEYIGFSHCPSLGVQKNVDLSRLLTAQDIDSLKMNNHE
ncbi:MAG: NYN domain-containing protein [Candidatus Pacebacteria bacterium]|nr:NYN domain-containing protein [Candidatus Paceibacterota bacterium]